MSLITESKSLHKSESLSMQWGLTQTKVVKCIYTWTIDNFSFCIEKTGEKITSPTFTTEGYNDINWCLDLYPKGYSSEDSDFVSLYLRLISHDKNEVKATFHFSIIDSEREERNLKNSQSVRIFNANSPEQQTSVGHGSKRFIRLTLLDKTLNLLPKDTLTIRCKVFFMVDRINMNGCGDTPQFKIQRRCILDDFGKLLEDMTLSDVTLVAGGMEIRAHKAILAVRCPVFAAMFEHDMQEQNQSRVDITDVGHNILKELLLFMYTDRAPNLDKMAADLLVAAEKYALDSLKMQCEEALCKNLSVETAADTLVMADLHSASLLKEYTMNFINTGHATMVMATEGWKNMTIARPHLVIELFKAASIQMQPQIIKKRKIESSE